MNRNLHVDHEGMINSKFLLPFLLLFQIAIGTYLGIWFSMMAMPDDILIADRLHFIFISFWITD
jgi:hypothetical protein